MFRDRADGGQQLARLLQKYSNDPSVLVLGLARGGVPVAKAVADALHDEMDVLLVRKLGVPWQPELGFGAIAEGGVRVLNDALVRECRLTPEKIEEIAARQEQELARRAKLYRGARHAPEVAGRTVLLVDDGLATGSTMFAAVRAMRQRKAGKVVVAVPVAPPPTCRALQKEADDVVTVDRPEPFGAVGAWYEDFTQVEDGDVQAILSS